MAKKKIKHAGIVAEVEEEDISEIALVDRRPKTQVQPAPEKYWTTDSIEAEKIANLGIKLIATLSPFGDLPKRWVFDITKNELDELLKKGA